MVIFNSYVSLPEGIVRFISVASTLLCLVSNFTIFHLDLEEFPSHLWLRNLSQIRSIGVPWSPIPVTGRIFWNHPVAKLISAFCYGWKTPCFLGSSQWSHHVTLQLPGLLKRFKKHPNPTTNEVMKYYMKYPIVQILIHLPWKTVPEVPSWHAEHHCCARHRAWSLQKSPGKVPDSGARKCVRGHGWVWLVNDET